MTKLPMTKPVLALSHERQAVLSRPSPDGIRANIEHPCYFWCGLEFRDSLTDLAFCLRRNELVSRVYAALRHDLTLRSRLVPLRLEGTNELLKWHAGLLRDLGVGHPLRIGFASSSKIVVEHGLLDVDAKLVKMDANCMRLQLHLRGDHLDRILAVEKLLLSPLPIEMVYPHALWQSGQKMLPEASFFWCLVMTGVLQLVQRLASPLSSAAKSS